MKYISALTTLLLSLSFFANSASIEELERQANNQDPIAQYSLSQALFAGQQVARDPQKGIEWLKISATNGYPLAQLKLADAYSSGIAIEHNLERAVYWYTKAAVQGLARAQLKLGAVYEQEYDESNQRHYLGLAEVWYKVALENNSKQAEEGLYRVQEALFNARRQAQLTEFKQLDTEFEQQNPPAPLSPAPETRPENALQQYLEHPQFPLAAGSVAGMLVLLPLLIWLRRRNQARNAEVREQETRHQQHESAKLRKELERAHRKLLKQNAQIGQYQSAHQEHGFALACAFLGFNPKKIPPQEEIKVRYKKLCRVYHPDANGSEEDMKKLNAALKTILKHVK